MAQDSAQRPWRAFGILMSMTAATIMLAACGGGSSGGSGVPDSGSGGSIGGAGAPASIIGARLVETVETVDFLQGSPNQVNVVQPGGTITYQFIDEQTILGEGVDVIPTTGWSYSRTGSNTAVVELHYVGGRSTEELTFTSDNSGRFVSHTELTHLGVRVRYTGTFRTSDIDTGTGTGGGSDGGSGDSGSGSGGSTEACVINDTGTITFWVSNPQAVGSVTVNLEGVGSRSTSHHFTGAGPACGSTGLGTMTFSDIPVRTYQWSANDATGTWGPGTVRISSACDCVRFELR